MQISENNVYATYLHLLEKKKLEDEVVDWNMHLQQALRTLHPFSKSWMVNYDDLLCSDFVTCPEITIVIVSLCLVGDHI